MNSLTLFDGIVRQFQRDASGSHRRLAALTYAHNLIENALRNFPLGSLGNIDDLVVSNDGHRVAIGVEADALAGHVVDYDGVELFGSQLLARIFEDILGFRGKADDDLRLLAERNLLEDIGSRFKLQRDRPFAFYFLRRG